MKKDEYISISEFAKRAGVSRNYIYKVLSTKLSPYYKEVDSQKRLNIKGLELFNVNQTVNQVDSKETEKDTLKDLIEILQEQQATLKAELEIKNEQIRTLNASLAQSHTLLDQQQKLQAIAERKRLETEEKEPQKTVKKEDAPLFNPDKMRDKGEYRAMVYKIMPGMPPKSIFTKKEDIAKTIEQQHHIYEKLNQEERELLKETGFGFGYEYLKDPSVID